MDNIILSLGMDDSSIRIDALSILIYISRDTHYKQQLADNDSEKHAHNLVHSLVLVCPPLSGGRGVPKGTKE